MKLTGRVRHRAAKEGAYGELDVLALQVEVLCDKVTPEDFRKGKDTTKWVNAKVEHLSEIDIRGALK